MAITAATAIKANAFLCMAHPISTGARARGHGANSVRRGDVSDQRARGGRSSSLGMSPTYATSGQAFAAVLFLRWRGTLTGPAMAAEGQHAAQGPQGEAGAL